MFLQSCEIKTCKLLITPPLKWKVTGRPKDRSRSDLGECCFNKCQQNEGAKPALAHVITGNKADNGETAAQPNKHADALVCASLPREQGALRPSPLLGCVLGQAHKNSTADTTGQNLAQTCGVCMTVITLRLYRPHFLSRLSCLIDSKSLKIHMQFVDSLATLPLPLAEHFGASCHSLCPTLLCVGVQKGREINPFI